MTQETANFWVVIIGAMIATGPTFLMCLVVWRSTLKTHKAVNSRLTELLEITRKAAKAEGKIEGAEERKP